MLLILFSPSLGFLANSKNHTWMGASVFGRCSHGYLLHFVGCTAVQDCLPEIGSPRLHQWQRLQQHLFLLGFGRGSKEQIPQTGWFKTTEIVCLTVLEARRLTSLSVGPYSLWNLLGSLSLPLLAPSGLLATLAFLGLQVQRSSPCFIVTKRPPYVSVFTQPSFCKISHIGLGPILLQYDLILTYLNYICNDPVSK